MNFEIVSGNGSVLSPRLTFGGEAETVLTSTTTPGPVLVEARVLESADTIEVVYLDVIVTLSANPRSIVADGTSTSTITADITDKNGTALSDDTEVEFKIIEGTGSIGSPRLTANGKATTTLTSNTIPGRVLIEARSINSVDTTEVAYKGIKVTLSADTTAIVANGLSSTTIVASVADDNGTSLSDGTEVIFNILPGGSGSVLSPSFTVGGTAMTKLTSSTTPDTVRVEAQVVNSRDTIAVVFKEIFLILTANPTDILSNGASTSTITALLKDADSNPVVSSEIQFSSTLGVIPRSAITDANGIATVNLRGERTEGIATVTARHSNIRTTVEVSIVKGQPASIVLKSVSATSIGIRGSSDNEVSEMVFEVQDDQGNRVGDGVRITFTIEGKTSAIVDGVTTQGGEFLTPTETATVGGLARMTLNSGIVAGTVRIIATAIVGSDTVESGPVPIAIHGGPPDQAHFSLAVNPLNLAGLVKFGLVSMITAFVFDEFSNPVPQGTSVQFQTLAGGI